MCKTTQVKLSKLYSAITDVKKLCANDTNGKLITGFRVKRADVIS